MTLEDAIKESIRYDLETGLLWWKFRKGGRRFNKPVGSTGNSNGYVQVCFRFEGKDRIFQGHRIAWLIHFGHWPDLKLDHIDRCRTNNRVDNLREVSDLENSWNQSLSKSNKSGYKGVCLHKRLGKYSSNVRHEGRSKHLGYYNTPEEAAEVYDEFVKNNRSDLATLSKPQKRVD